MINWLFLSCASDRLFKAMVVLFEGDQAGALSGFVGQHQFGP